MSQQLLQRAWDVIATFKEACPEEWDKQNEQVLKDLLVADIKMSGVELKWQGLTDEELQTIADEYRILFGGWVKDFARIIEDKLKDKNT